MDESLLADLDPSDALGDPDYLIEDLENFNPDVFLGGPLFVVSSWLSYAVEREDGLQRLESHIRERAQEATGGKFNKTDAAYSPLAPPPGVWDYRCRECRFFNEGEGEGGGGTCDLVGHDGDPFGGESINPDAWCALWLPEPGTSFFTYLKDRFEGEDN